jgi:zinc transport system ATP-binding protein
MGGRDVSVIEFRDVTFAYASEPVLREVTFAVAERELVGMVGPNGGGKTTLLRLILGLHRPQRGSIRVLGVSPESARHRVGYVPQHTHFDPQFPVSLMDVVLMGRLGRLWGGLYSRLDRTAACGALAEVGLDVPPQVPFADLSGGQRQRALIARALASEPELLLLDEATSNVDWVAQQQLYELLRRLSLRQTVLMVSHDLGVVSRFVSRVICVNRRVASHPTSELTGHVIQDVYGVEMALVRHDQDSPEEGDHG